MRKDLPFGEAEQWIVIALIITYTPAAVVAAPVLICMILHSGSRPKKTAGQSTGATSDLFSMPMR
jgi:hypothetical protein